MSAVRDFIDLTVEDNEPMYLPDSPMTVDAATEQHFSLPLPEPAPMTCPDIVLSYGELFDLSARGELLHVNDIDYSKPPVCFYVKDAYVSTQLFYCVGGPRYAAVRKVIGSKEYYVDWEFIEREYDRPKYRATWKEDLYPFFPKKWSQLDYDQMRIVGEAFESYHEQVVEEAVDGIEDGSDDEDSQT